MPSKIFVVSRYKDPYDDNPEYLGHIITDDPDEADEYTEELVEDFNAHDDLIGAMEATLH